MSALPPNPFSLIHKRLLASGLFDAVKYCPHLEFALKDIDDRNNQSVLLYPISENLNLLSDFQIEQTTTLGFLFRLRTQSQPNQDDLDTLWQLRLKTLILLLPHWNIAEGNDCADSDAFSLSPQSGTPMFEEDIGALFWEESWVLHHILPLQAICLDEFRSVNHLEISS